MFYSFILSNENFVVNSITFYHTIFCYQTQLVHFFVDFFNSINPELAFFFNSFSIFFWDKINLINKKEKEDSCFVQHIVKNSKWFSFSLFSNFSEGLSPENVWFFPYTGSVRFDGIVFLHNYITAIEWGLLLLILWISFFLLLVYFYMHSLGFLPRLSLFKHKDSFFSCTLPKFNSIIELPFKFISSFFLELSRKYKFLIKDWNLTKYEIFSAQEVNIRNTSKAVEKNLSSFFKAFFWRNNTKVFRTNSLIFSFFFKFFQNFKKNIILLRLNEKITKINGLKWHVFGRLIFLNSRVVHGQKLEIIWTIIPTIILVFIAYPSFFLLYTIEEILPTSIWSRALGRQWYWVYEYSWLTKMGGKTIVEESYLILENQLKTGLFRLLEVDNALILPVGMFMRFIVSASDVIHCFTIPSLGLKADGVPGRLNSTSAFIKRPGIYYGQCSELCGVGHGFMPIKAICLLFKYWVELFDCTLRTNLTNFSSFTFGFENEKDIDAILI